MKFTLATTVISFVLLPSALAASQVTEATVTAAFDPVYDNKGASLDTVSCSNGANGLESLGFTTFGSLPTFPNIGGAAQIGGFNSANCGACFNITFTNTKGVSKSITFTGIDFSQNGFVLSETALNTLTGGQAVQLGRVNVAFTSLPESACGIPA